MKARNLKVAVDSRYFFQGNFQLARSSSKEMRVEWAKPDLGRISGTSLARHREAARG